jgi:hypothetical protein
LPAEVTVVVASDDIRVRQIANDHRSVDEVSPIELMESEYAVSDAVNGIIEQVNDWLERVEASTMTVQFWHPQFGYGRRIQEAILLIRSYEALLDSYDPETVVVRHQRISYWETLVLSQTVERSSSALLKLDSPMVTGFRFWRNYLGNGANTPLPPIPGISQLSFLVTVVGWAKRLGSYQHRQMELNSTDTEGRAVGVQLLSDSPKHLEPWLALIGAIDERASLDGVGICWTNESGAASVSEQGHGVVELEAWYPLQAFLRDTLCVIRSWMRAKRHRDELDDIEYRGVELAPIIWAKIYEYFHDSGYERVLFRRASRRHFDSQDYEYFKVSGGGNYTALGALCQRILGNMSPHTTRFHYRGMPRYTNDPCFIDVNDLYFPVGIRERDRLIRQGVDEDKTHVVGMARYDEIKRFDSTTSNIDSFDRLELDDSWEKYVFFAPGWIIRGKLSARELELVTRCLFEFASTHPGVAVIVKPHPNDTSDLIHSLGRLYEVENVFILPKRASTYDCINVANVVVTKISSVGFEAIALKTPLIAIILDEGGTGWADQYGDAAKTFTGLDEMERFLDVVLSETEGEIPWFKDWERKRNRFVRENFRPDTDPYQDIAYTLSSR